MITLGSAMQYVIMMSHIAGKPTICTTRKKKLVRVPFDDVIISVKKHAQNQQNSKAPQKARQWQRCRRTRTLAREGFSVHTTMIHYDS